MDKLKRYLDKIEFTDYKPEMIGNDYFYNTPAPACNVVLCMFDYTGEKDFYTVGKQEKMIEKYCKRYNYKIFSRQSFPGYYSFFIGRYDEIENLEYYQMYVNNSVYECEKLIHEKGFSSTTDQELKAIMKDYENSYNMFLQSIAV